MTFAFTFGSTGIVAGGVYGFPHAESGVTLYPAWSAFTAAKSSGPFAWVCPSNHAYRVGDRNVCLMSVGTAPFHFGPAIKKLPAPAPVVRLPIEPKTSVHAF